MRRLTALCAAFRHCAVCHQNRQPAKAAFHVIKWSGNDLCQVWDDSVATKPWPSDYKVVSRPHKTLEGTLAVKAGLISAASARSEHFVALNFPCVEEGR